MCDLIAATIRLTRTFGEQAWQVTAEPWPPDGWSLKIYPNGEYLNIAAYHGDLILSAWITVDRLAAVVSVGPRALVPA